MLAVICNDKMKRVIPKVRLVKLFFFFFFVFSLSPLHCDVLRKDGQTDVQAGEEMSPVLYRQLFRTQARCISRYIRVTNFQSKKHGAGKKKCTILRKNNITQRAHTRC